MLGGFFAIMSKNTRDNIFSHVFQYTSPRFLRGNGHKRKHRRYHLNIRKHSFTVRMAEHWRKLPRVVVETPSLNIFKSHLDIVLGKCLQVALLELGVIGHDDLQRSFPTLTLLQFCEKKQKSKHEKEGLKKSNIKRGKEAAQ